MGIFSKKNKKGRPSSTYSQEPLTNMPGSGAPLKAQFSNTSQVYVLEEKDKNYKRTIRILRFISRLGSLILSVLMLGIFAYSLSRYYLTKSHVLPSDPTKTAWPVPTVLWPTYMLLGISLTTAITNAVTLAMYCFSVDRANKMNSVGSMVGYVLMSVHVLVWILATGAYKVAEMRGGDLWGYSCSGEADAIEEEVKNFLDFGRLCTSQGAAWYASIIQAALYLLAFIITVCVARRASMQKKLGMRRESVAFEMQGRYDPPKQFINPYMTGGYGAGDQETGMAFVGDGVAGKGKRYMPVAREVGALS